MASLINFKSQTKKVQPNNRPFICFRRSCHNCYFRKVSYITDLCSLHPTKWQQDQRDPKSFPCFSCALALTNFQTDCIISPNFSTSKFSLCWEVNSLRKITFRIFLANSVFRSGKHEHPFPFFFVKKLRFVHT